MNKIAIALALLGAPLTTQAAHAETAGEPAAMAEGEAGKSADELVRILTSPQEAWEARFEAEEQLMRMPSEPVLLALVPYIAEGMPKDVGIWNGAGSAQSDRDLQLPPRWQAFYAVHRVWEHHDMESLRAQTKPLALVSRRIIALLPGARSKVTLLSELEGPVDGGSYWTAEAEAPVLALMRDAPTDLGVRLAALTCLLRHTGGKYFAEAKAVTRALPEQQWDVFAKANFAQALVEAGQRSRTGKALAADEEVLQIAFSLLPQMEKQRPGGGYALALALGVYVGQEFKADQSDPKYKGQYSLTDSFFADTTANSLVWWRKHTAG